MTRLAALCLLCILLGPGPSCVIAQARAQARVIINRHSERSTFKPSDKWERVKEGQAIPPGLHVRFNLTSNTVEAKNMDSTTDNNPNTNMVVVPQEDLDQGSVKHKQPFRNYKEIKETLKELKIEAKSEVALMIELVGKAKKILNAKDYDDQELIAILTDLNDRVEQIDVGREFAKIGAIDDVVVASLNKSSEVKSSALILLGSALQNNQPVQIAAYKAGVLNKLLALIASEKDKVLARAMFSLSALVRRLPIAQKAMVDSGGAGLLIEVFNAHEHEPRIQGKILSLIYDLLVEQEDANLTLEEAGSKAQSDVGKEELREAIERQAQYKSIRLDLHLVNHGWCPRLGDFLRTLEGERQRRKIHKADGDECTNISQPDHSKVEKVVNAMLALGQSCRAEWNTSKEVACSIDELSAQYEALRRCEKENSAEADEEVAHYYGSIAQRLDRLAKLVAVDDGQPLQCKHQL